MFRLLVPYENLLKMNSEIYPYQLKLGAPTISIEILGGNSSVYKGHLPDGSEIAIKEYKGDKQRIGRMLSREQRAISFLREHGIPNVPEILEVRKDLGLVVYRWIEGIAPLANHETMKAIIDLYSALDEIHESGAIFDNAIDAAFSIKDISLQISTRIQQFQTSYGSLSVSDLCARLSERLHLCNPNQAQSSNFTRFTLSVSDLGAHNIIFSGSDYTFIDFEFFGTDSVNKLVGDFLLHPRNEFNEVDISRFIESASQISNWDANELNEVMPLLTLKWAVIAFGRTFREANLGELGEISEEQIRKSLGSLYLDFFDSLQLGEVQNSFITFRSFEGRISQS
jgi:hypothetical protein